MPRPTLPAAPARADQPGPVPARASVASTVRGGRPRAGFTKAATLRIERLPLSELRPHPRNPRRHPEPGSPEWGALKSSLAHDYFDPLVWNRRNGTLVSGHLPVKVLREMGFTAADVVVVDYDEPTHLARLVAANRAIGEDDQDLLAKLLGELDGAAALTGIAADELKQLLEAGAPAEDTPPRLDEAIALQKKWKTKTGQLWALGEHRLLCGDCTDPDVVSRMGKANLCVTDPPYGVDYDPEWRTESGLKRNGRDGVVEHDDRVDWTQTWKLFLGNVIYCWHAGRHANRVQNHLEAADFEMRSQIIWAKTRFAIGRGNYHWQHEPCWYAVRRGCKANWQGDRSQTTLWTIGLDENTVGGHSTQKPLECMARAIRNHTGDVYDPFLGSGTTLIAAENLGRRCFGIEIAPRYVAVALQRWAEHTGRTPSLA